MSVEATPTPAISKDELLLDINALLALGGMAARLFHSARGTAAVNALQNVVNDPARFDDLYKIVYPTPVV